MSRLKDLLSFYYHQRIKGFEVSGQPHLDEVSHAELARRLRAATTYLEYGAGGSTFLARKLNVSTTTVESDRFFARAVLASLPVDTRHKMIVVDIGLTAEWGIPLFKRTTERRLRRWSRYPVAPFGGMRRELFPDLILIDGRFRVSCALECVRRSQTFGVATTILIDDYIDDAQPRGYGVLETYLGRPQMVGRMAVFEIDGGVKAIRESDVADHIGNYW